MQIFCYASGFQFYLILLFEFYVISLIVAVGILSPSSQIIGLGDPCWEELTHCLWCLLYVAWYRDYCSCLVSSMMLVHCWLWIHGLQHLVLLISIGFQWQSSVRQQGIEARDYWRACSTAVFIGFNLSFNVNTKTQTPLFVFVWDIMELSETCLR